MQANKKDFTCSSVGLYNELYKLGNSKEKHIPFYAKNWSTKYLNVLLDWMLLGDGCNRKDRDGQLLRELCTVSKRLTDDTQEIMLKIGNGGSISFREPEDRLIEGRLIKAENQEILHTIHEHSTQGSWFSKDTQTELVDYDGEVFCVTAPKNHTWLMKYNNKTCWTSNCDHPEDSIVSLERISHVVREAWWQGDEVWGKVQILNTPKGRIIQDLMEGGIKIGISSRGIGDVVKNESGADVVDENFMLIAFDLVSEPSTHNAFLHESKQVSYEDIKKMISKTDRLYRIANEILSKV